MIICLLTSGRRRRRTVIGCHRQRLSNMFQRQNRSLWLARNVLSKRANILTVHFAGGTSRATRHCRRASSVLPGGPPTPNVVCNQSAKHPRQLSAIMLMVLLMMIKIKMANSISRCQNTTDSQRFHYGSILVPTLTLANRCICIISFAKIYIQKKNLIYIGSILVP